MKRGRSKFMSSIADEIRLSFPELSDCPSEGDFEWAVLSLCRSGKFETGQGTCAAICMSQLGDARKIPCVYRSIVFRELLNVIFAPTDDRDRP